MLDYYAQNAKDIVIAGAASLTPNGWVTFVCNSGTPGSPAVNNQPAFPERPAVQYSTPMPGLTLGLAMTLGRVLGKELAAK